ncbi:MAG: metal ABC transporter permease [Flammeovirgaceae bacterium]|jgi:manganese/zinc/iron transport system permease protein|nr:metal ABC transporter permease [Flammeovirgaceae bacterium]
MENVIDFFSFSDPNVRYVTLGIIFIMACAAMVGTFTFLTKKSLLGDAIAHAVLPGICVGFMLAGTKNPFVLIPAAFAFGWLSLLCIDFITNKSRIKEDTAIGLVLSLFFAIGIFLLTIIQKNGNANQSGLDHFLFGKAAALVMGDIIAFSIVALLLMLLTLLFFKEFTLISFDKNFAISSGVPVRALEILQTGMIVLTVVIGIQAVGVVLMAAVLITPAAVARYWTDNIKTMLAIALLTGVFSGIAGAYLSYSAPNMPTGPWIVIFISTLALLSFFLSPKKGIINKILKQKRYKRQIQDENVLKTLYQLGEKTNQFFLSQQEASISDKRFFAKNILSNSLHRLMRNGFVTKQKNAWQLTDAGKLRGQRLVKIHRLWELYLTTYANIAPDHVHEDADTIEHFLTPELEAALEQQLNFPEKDPHQTIIPYQ